MTLAGLAGAGITFGDRLFTEPAPLPSAGLPRLWDEPGLYAILVPDSRWQPCAFRPLYFGESEGVWEGATTAHEKYESWRREAGPLVTLYRALHGMPGSTRPWRQAGESALITAYGTPCNERLSLGLAALLGVKTVCDR